MSDTQWMRECYCLTTWYLCIVLLINVEGWERLDIFDLRPEEGDYLLTVPQPVPHSLSDPLLNNACRPVTPHHHHLHLDISWQPCCRILKSLALLRGGQCTCQPTRKRVDIQCWWGEDCATRAGPVLKRSPRRRQQSRCVVRCWIHKQGPQIQLIK